MNKSLLTNSIALLLVIIGYFSPIYGQAILMTGVFALSGAITNWIAIHMLFEKVPFLYGSGVIPSRFEDFKTGIKTLIIEEFFNRQHIEQFFQKNSSSFSVEAINNKIDFDKVFEDLKDAIIESPMGTMLAMFGGKDALNPLKEPITEKLKNIVNDLAENKDGSFKNEGLEGENSGKNSENDFTQNLINEIEKIIDNRLADLTPQMVKEIIQKMIRKHLGWLVVWGGVFGGLIGLGFSTF
jgi:uncharacterized membrane protein YheB (UPF0754 family)